MIDLPIILATVVLGVGLGIALAGLTREAWNG